MVHADQTHICITCMTCLPVKITQASRLDTITNTLRLTVRRPLQEPEPASIRHRHVVLSTDELKCSFLRGCVLTCALVDNRSRRVTHILFRSIFGKSPRSGLLATMDSPIVKATIQSTLLGVLSNTLGQLIGCWQSGVSHVLCTFSSTRTSRS